MMDGLSDHQTSRRKGPKSCVGHKSESAHFLSIKVHKLHRFNRFFKDLCT